MQLHGVNIPDDSVAELCRRYGVRRLWIFGSALRGDARPGGDVDVLIETDGVGLLALGGLQMDLSDLLGREVHMTTLGGVPPAERPRLLAAARLEYAA